MATAYLTASQALERLKAHEEVDAAATVDSAGLTDAGLRLASDAIDSGPFPGERYASTQARAFPRTYTRPGDIEGAVPENILDAVALLAHEEQQEETQPVAIRSEGVLDQSITYAAPVLPRSRRRIGGLIAPYLRKTGARL